MFSKDNPFGKQGIYDKGTSGSYIQDKHEKYLDRTIGALTNKQNAEMDKTLEFAHKQQESDKYLDRTIGALTNTQNAEMAKTLEFAHKQQESDNYPDSTNIRNEENTNEFKYKLESSGVSPPFLLSTKEGEFKLELSTENISKSWNKKNIQKIILTEYIGSGSFKTVYKFKGEKGEEYNNLCISIAEGKSSSSKGKIKNEIEGHKNNFDIIHNSQQIIDHNSSLHFINIYQYGYYCKCFDNFRKTEKCTKETKCPGNISEDKVVGVYAIMEYAPGGDLKKRFGIINTFKQYPGIGPFFPLWNDWFLQISIRLIKNICIALNLLHNKGYVHLDIKPANIVLMLSEDEKMPVDIKPEIISQEEWSFLNNGNIKLSKEDKWSIIKNTKIKIIDFGSATKIKKFKVDDEVQIDSGSKTVSITGIIDDENYQTKEGDISISDIYDKTNHNVNPIGTPYFIDPFFLINSGFNQKNYCSKLTDMWSLGVTFFELFTGKNPWSKKNYENVATFFLDISNQIKSNKELLDDYFDKYEFNKLGKIVQEIIGYMLKQNIKERKDCSFILEIISKYNLDLPNKSGGKKKKSIKKKGKKYKLTKKKKRKGNRINY
jgi:serine/threonine protein kinase